MEQIHKYTFDHPEIFDALHAARYEPECAFLEAIFQAQSGINRVLDAACGTGAHLALLAQQGYATTGSDLNAHMLAYARRRHAEVAFVQADMRALGFSPSFDALICLCTSFSYNRTNHEVAAALQSFRRCLRSGGLLVIDVFNPISLIESRSYSPEFKEEDRHGRLGLVSTSQVTIDPSRQLLIESRTISDQKTGRPLQTDTTEFRLFFPQELRYFLETNGFRLLDFYSAFDPGRRDLNGSRLIAVAMKD